MTKTTIQFFIYVVRFAIWYQKLTNGIQAIGQNAVLTS